MPDPIKTYTDWEKLQAALEQRHKGEQAPINSAYKSCSDGCDALTNVSAATRASCHHACDAARSAKMDPLVKIQTAEGRALRKRGVDDGLIFEDSLIITDTKNASFAARLRTGVFAKAVIVQVSTANDFIAELQKDRFTVSLILVFDGDAAGRIKVDGEIVSSSRLTNLKLVVNDTIYLEGTAGTAFRAVDALKKLGAAGIRFEDNWLLQLPAPPTVGVGVDPQDGRTHPIDSTLGSSGLAHFVTVRGDGRIMLQAKLLTNDSAANRKAITWEASPGTTLTVSPSDPLKVSLSRQKSKKITVSVKFAGSQIAQFLVWVIWSDLTPVVSGTSAFDAKPLGEPPQVTRLVTTAGEPACKIFANVDWLISITPATVISDADRPALEGQTSVAVPGVALFPPGEPVVPRAFFGWDVAADVRFKQAELVPPARKARAKTEAPYQWANGDAEGITLVDDRGNPYTRSKPGWASRWDAEFLDRDGINRQVERFHRQARIFVRVQLDTTWYRCSNSKKYRFQGSVKRSAGKWNVEPGTTPEIKLNNAGW